MLTRCPHCHTIFRAEPSQLETYQGLVRCGQCLQAFNALIHQQHDVIDTTSHTPYTPSTLSAADYSPTHTVNLQDTSSTEPSYSHSANTQHTPKQGGWLLIAVLLALIIVAQLLFAYRAPLAQQSALIESVFNSLCRYTGCVVPLAQQLDKLSIEASNLEAEPNNKSQLLLSASIKNTAAYKQALPSISLTINGIDGKAESRKLFTPHDYLTDHTNSFIHAHDTLELKLKLKLHDIEASGYKLELFY